MGAGADPVRLRQRRRPRPLPHQRPHRNSARRTRATRPRTDCTGRIRTERSPTSRPSRASVTAATAWEWPSVTSTTTATADVYVTNYGPDALYLNRGDGTFEDITTAAGIDVPGWTCSAAFLDYDRDGFLDLFLTQYVDFELGHAQVLRRGRPPGLLRAERRFPAGRRRAAAQQRRRDRSPTSAPRPAPRPGEHRARSRPRRHRRRLTPATAGSTSMSPTTPTPTTSGSTRATARSSTPAG